MYTYHHHLFSIIAIQFTTLFTGISREILIDYEPKSTNQPFCTKGSKREEKNEVALSRRGEVRICQRSYIEIGRRERVQRQRTP